MKKEFERIMAIQDQDEQAAERKRMVIIDNILTFRCPGCRIDFFDYDGCATLTCGKCGVGFCAYCLQFDPRSRLNAHTHVQQCIKN